MILQKLIQKTHTLKYLNNLQPQQLFHTFKSLTHSALKRTVQKKKKKKIDTSFTTYFLLSVSNVCSFSLSNLF